MAPDFYDKDSSNSSSSSSSIGDSSSTNNNNSFLPLSRSNVMLMNIIPEGDEALVSGDGSGVLTERSLGSRSLSFSLHNGGHHTNRSVGGRSEMSEASAMSVSPRILPDGGGSKWDDELLPEDVPALELPAGGGGESV